MTKGEMADKLKEAMFEHDVGITKKTAMTATEAVLGFIVEELKVSGEFRYHEFGTFKVQQRNARKGRNPHTGAEIDIPAKKVVKFKPAPAILRALGN